MTTQPLLELCVKLHTIVRSYTVITNAMHLLLHKISIDNTLRIKSIMWTTRKMLFIPYQQSTCVSWSVFGTEIKTIHTVHHFLDRFSIFHQKHENRVKCLGYEATHIYLFYGGCHISMGYFSSCLTWRKMASVSLYSK